MPRFFVGENQIADNKITIVGQDVKHIKNVLRMAVGQNVDICDDKGRKYACEIENIAKEEITVKILSCNEQGNEPGIPVTILQGVPKGEKMELIIQKNVELGITKIVPVIMERCVVKFQNQQDKEKKAARWNKIAMEAAKQCGRSIIPKVLVPENLSKVIAELPQDALLITASENEKTVSLKEILQKEKPREIYFIIGPEGGIASSEEECLKNAGFNSVSLGPRILRTETAGFALLSAIRYEYGD